jgi:DNA-binding response OmpR family regulator
MTGTSIWLIAPTWQVRALVRAQLIEEGYEVTAVEGWDALAELLGEEVTAPHLVIVELTGAEPPGALSLLRSMPVPRIALRAAGDPTVAALRAEGVDRVLSRPYSVGDVAHAVRALLDP